uniref:BHLH domain-containing protein n=1 Tax=Leersia perrieri TaxID=77586 RepID=A0A0D9W8A5_9ORYZ
MHGRALQLYRVVFHCPRSSSLLHCNNKSTTSRGMWESRHQNMQTHSLFAGAADTAFSSSPAADALIPSEHIGGHLWNQNVISSEENFLSLLDDTRDVMALQMFDGVPVASSDYLKGLSMDDAGDMAASSTVAAYNNMDTGCSVAPLGKNNKTVVQQSIQSQEVGAPMAAFLQQLIPTSVLDHSGIGIEGVYPDGSALGASFCMRTSPEIGSFSGYRSTTAEELMSTDTKEQEVTRLTRTCSSNGTDTNKKRRSEGRVGGNTKKSRSETSHASSPKPQAPTVKLGEKITALQQIVSPFGKTDTASVLLETINYIKFLHEQIQLFSQPYLTNSTNKGHIHLGVEERMKAGLENDLVGRGLCLAPVSLTPQVYHDNILPECWTPTYRNYLYR